MTLLIKLFFYFILYLHHTVSLTSISVLVQISNTVHRHPKHGVICTVESDWPRVIVPVTKWVQININSSTNFCLTVKKVWSANNQVGPATKK